MNVKDKIPQQIIQIPLILNNICILCGIEDESLVNIYSEEVIEHDISNKLELYLPAETLENCKLSSQCCWECITSVLAWHKFVQKTLEATLKFKELHSGFVNDKQEHDHEERLYEETDKEISHEEEDCDNSKDGEHQELKGDEIEDVEQIVAESSKTNIKTTKTRRKKDDVQHTFFCELCNKGFTRKFDLQRHRKTKHSDAEIVEPPARRNNKLLNKCRIFENGKTLFECDICKHRTKQSYNLLRHRTIHTGDKQFVCHICGKSFRLDSSLRKHITQYHERLKKFKCEICNREFGTKSTKDEHMNTHTDNRPFPCDICQKSFRQKASLFIHKLYHEKNFRFECSLCEKKFRRAQELVVHNRIHTGQKPYECDLCGYRFRRTQDLKNHKKVHLKTREEWICLDCKSTFTEERYLKLHRKIHI